METEHATSSDVAKLVLVIKFPVSDLFSSQKGPEIVCHDYILTTEMPCERKEENRKHLNI